MSVDCTSALLLLCADMQTRCMLLVGVMVCLLHGRYAATRTCETLLYHELHDSSLLHCFPTKLLGAPQSFCDFPFDLTLLSLHLIGLGGWIRSRAVETSAGPSGDEITKLLWELPPDLSARVSIALWDLKEQVSCSIWQLAGMC